jgi:hypothetical protein
MQHVVPSAGAGNLRSRTLSVIKIRTEIMRIEVAGNVVRSSRRMLLMGRREARRTKWLLCQFGVLSQNRYQDALNFLP